MDSYRSVLAAASTLGGTSSGDLAAVLNRLDGDLHGLAPVGGHEGLHVAEEATRWEVFDREPAPDVGVLGWGRCVGHESGAFVPFGAEPVQGPDVGGVGGVVAVEYPVIVEVERHDLGGSP